MKTTKEISSEWSEYDKMIALSQLTNYGVIYLDEYNLPIDDEYLLEELVKGEKMNKEQKDVTSRYLSVIDGFSCDFGSALEKGSTYNLAILDALIASGDVDLIEDIHKLCELAFNLRRGKCKIIEI